jgi:hypothetical protein
MHMNRLWGKLLLARVTTVVTTVTGEKLLWHFRRVVQSSNYYY